MIRRYSNQEIVKISRHLHDEFIAVISWVYSAFDFTHSTSGHCNVSFISH